MPYPAAPVKETSYLAFQQTQGDNSFPGAQLDADLANLRAAVTGTQSALRRIQRSDDALGNQTVGHEQLKPSLILGIDPPTGWTTATSYAISDTVFENDGYYICEVAHVSGDFTADRASGFWTVLIDFAPYIADGVEAAIGSVVVDLVGDALDGAISASHLMRHVDGITALNAVETEAIAAVHMSDVLRDAVWFWDPSASPGDAALDPKMLTMTFPVDGQSGAWTSGYGDPRMGMFSDDPVPARKVRSNSGLFVGKKAAHYYGALSDTASNDVTAFWPSDVGEVGSWTWPFATAMNIFERSNGKINTSIISQSPLNTAGGLTMGLQVSVVGVNTGATTHGLWGIYGEAIAMEQHVVGHVRNFEFNVVNKSVDITNSMSEKPYTSGRTDLRFGGAFAAGGDITVHGSTYSNDQAIRINQNGANFWTGIMIRNNALARDTNDEAKAMAMAVGHSLVWYGPGDVELLRIVAKNTTGHIWRMSFGDTELGITHKAKRVVGLLTDDNPANYVSMGQSAAGVAVPLRALGDDTNIDILFDPKGATGTVDFGVPLQASGTFTANRRMVVKINGVTHYLLASTT